MYNSLSHKIRGKSTTFFQKHNVFLQIIAIYLHYTVQSTFRIIHRQRKGSFSREWGADSLTFKTAQLYDYAKGHPLMPSDERYSRYKRQKDGTYRLKRRLSWGCHRLFTGCVMDADGRVLPCCFDKARQFAFGRLCADMSFRSVWESESEIHSWASNDP